MRYHRLVERGQEQNAAELEVIYRNRFDEAEAYRNQVWQTLIRSWFQRHIPAGATVLDLGCGYGQFINHVSCARKYAMDLNPASRRRLQPDVIFLEQDCSAEWQIEGNSLDVVFTSNFFEHLFTKAHLTRTVEQALRCLKKGGKIIAMGPNIKYVPGLYWDYFDHHLALTELSLRECFEICGFRTELVIDRFLPYTMVNAPQYPLFFLRAYLLMPLAWKLLGKQFVVIASKP